MENTDFLGTDKVSKILIKLAPPVMLAQLIQALYNIVDSFFVGRVMEECLTALSIVYPLQLLMIALAVGTGVGINTAIDHYLGIGNKKKAEEIAGVGTPLTLLMWILFAGVCYFIMPAYAKAQSSSETVIDLTITYGRIVCVFSVGLFTESIWTKILQANGNMKLPMIAQISGAVINIALDPLLIFSCNLGIAGAAIATVIGQVVAALIVFFKGFRKSPGLKEYPKDILLIYKLGLPNILMQAAYTFYILGLNLILSKFSDQAVTVLGLYYKWQTFFFIPLGALQTCMVPILSYNYARHNIQRCRETCRVSLLYGILLMLIGVLCFELMPGLLLKAFSSDPLVISIGEVAFRIIGISFIPLVTSLLYPVFFQAVGYSGRSSILTIIRTVFCFVPLGYLFSFISLDAFWWIYPITEVITTIFGFIFYYYFIKNESKKTEQAF